MNKTKFQKRCLLIGIILTITAACLQIINCANLQGYEWTRSDKVAAAALVVGRGADMISTHDAMERGAHETNIFLGEHPDDGTLALLWIGSSILCLAIAHYMPSEYREIFLCTISVISGGVAIKNYFETR